MGRGRKLWPPEPALAGTRDLMDPIPIEKQPPVRTRYIWNIPREEWPAGITAVDVAEMKRRHDKQLREKRKQKKEERDAR